LKDRVIPFLKYRYWAYGFSMSLFIIFVIITIIKGGLPLGVDFVGGLKLIVKFEKGVHEEQIRTALKEYSPTVQQIGELDTNSYIISTKLKENSAYLAQDEILNLLEQKYPRVEILKDNLIIVSIKSAADEGAVKAKLAGMDAVLQKVGDARKNEYVIYKKETQDKKSKYNSDAIETALKSGIPSLEVLSGISLLALFDKPVEESVVKSMVNKYGVTVARSEYAARQGYVLCRVAFDESEKIKTDLIKSFKTIEVLSVENVGPAVGKYLRKSALWLIVWAIILMTVYLAYRFEVRYAVGAMVALVHDVTLATAFCGVAGIEINIPVVAALLTIFGYSVNDTIVIFDRIREDTHMDTKTSFVEVMNRAITQTLSRTTLTVLLTLFSVIALYMIGGEGITDFALVLIFGFIIGAYSSIYQASPVVLWWENFIKKVKAT
jgi:preprotein translocase SecF subunit